MLSQIFLWAVRGLPIDSLYALSSYFPLSCPNWNYIYIYSRSRTKRRRNSWQKCLAFSHGYAFDSAVPEQEPHFFGNTWEQQLPDLQGMITHDFFNILLLYIAFRHVPAWASHRWHSGKLSRSEVAQLAVHLPIYYSRADGIIRGRLLPWRTFDIDRIRALTRERLHHLFSG